MQFIVAGNRAERARALSRKQLLAISVSFRDPVTRATRTAGIAAPGPTAGRAREPAGAGGVFVLNRHRSANRARTRHVAPEPDKVGMCDIPSVMLTEKL